MPPPLLPVLPLAVLPLRVQLVTVRGPKFEMAPPPPPTLPFRVQPASAIVPLLLMAPPELALTVEVVELPVNVLPVTVVLLWMSVKIAPPAVGVVLLVKVQPLTVSKPSL